VPAQSSYAYNTDLMVMRDLIIGHFEVLEHLRFKHSLVYYSLQLNEPVAHMKSEPSGVVQNWPKRHLADAICSVDCSWDQCRFVLLRFLPTKVDKDKCAVSKFVI
jgi:hypothetical protein